MNSQGENFFTAVIAAAGCGSRMGGGIDKLMLDLAGKPVIIRCIEAFEKFCYCSEIIVVTSKKNVKFYNGLVREYSFKKIKGIFLGGSTRQESVYRGLLRAKGEYVAVHDGARPLLSNELLIRLWRETIANDSCIPVVPVKDTIKIIGDFGLVEKTLDRRFLYKVQTPQFFRTSLLRKAYEVINGKNLSITDDSSIMENSGYKVKTTLGDYENIKITTPDDIDIASLFFSKKN